MRTVKLFGLVAVLCCIALPGIVNSHCQIPCGIYGDSMRFEMMAEHIKTIEKSMTQIVELSADEKPDMNQIVRWVNNKDLHADELSEIITYYFMAQRIAPVENQNEHYKEYVDKLITLHELLVYSMKAKQSTDLEIIKKLNSSLKSFKAQYEEK